MEGVYRTRSGYAGGSLEDPTYRNLGDHTETIQVEFDPSVITYAELLQVFWDSHNPTGRPWSRQYMSIIFYHDPAQEQAARDSKAAVEANLGTAVYTELAPFINFYLAEEYHQKYYLQGISELTAELRAYYPDYRDFTDSTAAARINGLIAGYGSIEQLLDQIDGYGLSSSGKEKLKSLVK